MATPAQIRILKTSVDPRVNGTEFDRAWPFMLLFVDGNDATLLHRPDGTSTWVPMIGGDGGGADGASAYEVAVANGFVGTEAAWLVSLVGPQGPQGPQGNIGPEGPQGPPGEDGVAGPHTHAIADVTGLQTALDGKQVAGSYAAAVHTHAQSDITNLSTDLAAKAPLASPTFTGTPAAPTAAGGTNTTQLATTQFVQSAIASVIAAAPGALDTLDELAAALGDDANFAATMTTALAGKQPSDAGLSSIAALGATAGLLEKTATDTYTERAIGVGTAASIPTRADADTRYAAASHTHTAGQVTGLAAVATSGSAADLGTGTLPAARLGANAIDGTKLFRGATAGHVLTSNGAGADPTYQAAPGAGGGGALTKAAAATVAAGADQTWLVRDTNSADITGVTLTTVMEITGVGPGRYRFSAMLIYQATALTTGIDVAATHTGTTTQWLCEHRFAGTGGAAATAAAAENGAAATGNIYEAQGNRTKNAIIGAGTVSVDTINADMMSIVEGFFVVTVSGDLQIKLAAEAAGLVVRAMQGSNIILQKLS